MAEKTNVPEIRFAGFTDPWEQRKFSELATLRRGLTYSPANIRPYGQGVRVLRSSNIAEDEFVLSREDVFVDEDVVKMDLVQDDEILITAANGSPRLVGKRAKIHDLAGKTVHGGFMLCARAEQPDFVVALMGSQWYQRFLATGVAGGNGSIGNLDKEALENETALIPRTEEQRLIGAHFSRLDALITLHQRKYDKLAQLKKSMLDKMFPKPGERFPEIRFAGFTDPWEQRKLGELLLERNEQAPQSDQYPLMAFIANQGIAPKGDRYDRSALVNDIEGKLYKRTEKGDFIYSSNNLETGSIGLNKYGNACISPVYCIFQPSGIADSDFLGRRLVRKDFIQEMVKWRQGVIYGQWRIHEADFLRLNIAVPSVDEQRLIGKLLDNLDALITLHQRKLELLRNTKKSLLDRMFV